MLIDRLMPHCDFAERHVTRVRAEPERIYEVVRRGNLAVHPVVRLLLSLRGMRRSPQTHFSFDDFLRQGFVLLADDPPRELVLGIEGPFWKPSCKLRAVTEESFRASVPSGVARAAWNFFIARSGDACEVITETRVLCAPDARATFALYWTFIRPFSGLIRRFMLGAIRQEAERVG